MNDVKLLRTLTLLLAVAEEALCQLDVSGEYAGDTRSAVATLAEELQRVVPQLHRHAA